MKLKELYHLRSSLLDLWDFTSNHLDGDETDLTDKMSEHYGKSLGIVNKEICKLNLRNALARLKRGNQVNP